MSAAITRRQIPLDERMDFLPARTGSHFYLFEKMVYYFASTQSNYTGGYWEFYELSNGGWYMAYADEGQRYQFNCPNFFQGELSSDAAGIALSLLAINNLLWQLHETEPGTARKLNDAFYALRDYASTHQEAAAIFGVID